MFFFIFFGGLFLFFLVLEIVSDIEQKKAGPPVKVLGDDGRWHCLHKNECPESEFEERNPHAI